MRKKRAERRVPLFDLAVSPAARRYVNDALASGWLTAGPKVKAFEAAVARLTGVRHAAAVASGTQGLHLALAACGGVPGREVVTTPYTFVATVEAILLAGGTPVFADIDPHTLTIDPDAAARKVGKKTAAVVPVDIAGHPCDYPRLNDLCGAHNLPLVADAAHAIGGAYRRRAIPKLCDAAVYSFYSTKNLTAGEGGMAVSRHKELIDRIRLLARHGLTSSTYERKLSNRWEYDAVAFGWKANMAELSAAVGLGEIERFGANQRARAAAAARYRRHLAALAEYVVLPTEAPDCTHSWHLYIIKLRTEALRIGRDRFIREMAARGVECGVHYKPVYELSWYRRAFDLSARPFPNAEWAWRRAVTLPLYPTLAAADVDYVCACIAEIAAQFRR
ncbi:MAG TPA: DegT/DnrJ/EryC1/StrS family aminotransferase [candidate division Zixibacteria bacterium]|nr:DegT/DnrJ/EryC1/StrS family aminotransferase [candidate division Zixibacteria bacterium]MDD4916403.1 DegT/DnrJ/EryC1/StrS family aminotransferase [candidate division Zixibacteria bacterium]MDM7974223.1 DegT/DnrJ/EryC1/StrS family aminotransferase [candidate division Zixibacteria bacterium]HOD65672.1 DegT/DnrJ/EryC1/StrS family aminotransferase [candidate division Zixibacteria bacterium]HPM37708.1 DegT/DnrJ/EryC1/StrS family aminotransferase [candidate division Zixibacteria bacterium]